jgi:hypothetical protein
MRKRPEHTPATSLLGLALSKVNAESLGMRRSGPSGLVRCSRWSRVTNAAAAILIAAVVIAGAYGLDVDSLWTLSQDQDTVYVQPSEPDEVYIGAISEPGSEEMMLAAVGLVLVLLCFGMDRALSTDHAVCIPSS